MKKYIFIFLIFCLSCGVQNTSNRKKLKINPKFKKYHWYYGKIGNNPIWLYVLESDSIINKKELKVTTVYGFDVQKGIYKELNGTLKDDSLSLQNGSIQKIADEFFKGKLNQKTGIIQGIWIKNQQKVQFTLYPINTIPQNKAEFLNALTNLSLNQNIAQQDFKSIYQEKKIASAIPNLKTFLPKLKMIEDSGVLLGKILLKDTYLIFVRYDMERILFSNKNKYEEYKKDIYAMLLLDKNIQILDLVEIGAKGRSLDLSLKVDSQNQIIADWSYLGRGINNKRIVLGGKTKVWGIGNNKFLLLQEEKREIN